MFHIVTALIITNAQFYIYSHKGRTIYLLDPRFTVAIITSHCPVFKAGVHCGPATTAAVCVGTTVVTCTKWIRKVLVH